MLNIPFDETFRSIELLAKLSIPAGLSQRRMARSRYRPHQSDRECARRVRQMQRAVAKAADKARYDEVMRRLRAGARFDRLIAVPLGGMSSGLIGRGR